MLRSLIGAFLVCRLELRQLPLELEALLAQWRHRPAIEIVIPGSRCTTARSRHLRRRLDEVFPF